MEICLTNLLFWKPWRTTLQNEAKIRSFLHRLLNKVDIWPKTWQFLGRICCVNLNDLNSSAVKTLTRLVSSSLPYVSAVAYSSSRLSNVSAVSPIRLRPQMVLFALLQLHLEYARTATANCSRIDKDTPYHSLWVSIYGSFSSNGGRQPHQLT